MRKSFLLAIVPALLVLSGCKPLASGAVRVNGFAEDATAQSEIFGNRDVVGGNLQIKKRDPGQAITTPKIGYQIHYESSTLAIRFIAAVKDLNVKAYWRRGVAGPDGNAINDKDFSDDPIEATKYYTSLSDGTNTITAGEDSFADYEGFVVYTIHGIPYNTANKKAYVAAYVNLVGDENGEDDGIGGKYNVHNNSSGLAVSIERKTEEENETDLKNVFTFNPLMNKHFLEGTINGVTYDGGTNGLYEESGSTPSGNHAWYENIALKKTDAFGSFYYDHDRIFQFFGYSTFSTESTSFLTEGSLSEFNAPIKDGVYKLYVSAGSGEPKEHENCIYTNVVYFNEDIVVWLVPSEKWVNNGARYAIHYFDSAASDPVGWVSMVSDGAGIYKATIPAKYCTVIFCAMDPASSTDNWDNKWNQTGNISLSSMPGASCKFIKGNTEWNADSGDHFEVKI